MSRGGFQRKQTEDEARLIKAKADREEMKAGKEAEELAPLTEVEKEWTAMCLSFRNKMLGIPAALSGQLADEENPAEINSILKRAINEALEELSKDQ